jgi:hypothetical protein
MMCPVCGIEMRVGSTRTREEDDHKIVEQDLVCRNPQCPNYKTVVETVEIQVD